MKSISFENAIVIHDQLFSQKLSELPEVQYVEEDSIGVVDVASTSWGLDRIDQRDLPFDDEFNIQGDALEKKRYTNTLFCGGGGGGRSIHIPIHVPKPLSASNDMKALTYF